MKMIVVRVLRAFEHMQLQYFEKRIFQFDHGFIKLLCQVFL